MIEERGKFKKKGYSSICYCVNNNISICKNGEKDLTFHREGKMLGETGRLYDVLGQFENSE